MRTLPDPGRRQLLRGGLGLGLTLWLGSTLSVLSGCSQPVLPGRTWLRAKDVQLLQEVAPALLVDLQPADLASFIDELEAFYLSTSAATLQQIRQIFDLLTLAPTRRWLTGHADFAQLSKAELAGVFTTMRASSSSLRVAIAGFFTQSLALTWYKRPSSWQAVGYEQPAHQPCPIAKPQGVAPA